MVIDEIYLSFEGVAISHDEEWKEITDVLVVMKSGRQYVSSFFSFRQIDLQRKRFEQTGDFLNGNYFWAKRLILIDKCERESIRNVIEHLIEEGDFLDAFQRLDFEY